MKIKTIKALPSSKELMEILQKEYSEKYSFKLFGIGDEKSIIVRKSFFIGAQISKNENEITIDGIPPSALSSLVAILLQQLANLFILFNPSRYKKVEKELSVFLYNKYT